MKNISENDVIFAKPDIDYFQNLDTVVELHNYLRKVFPNNKIITIPKNLELDIDEWDEVYKNTIEYLQSIKP